MESKMMSTTSSPRVLSVLSSLLELIIARNEASYINSALINPTVSTGISNCNEDNYSASSTDKKAANYGKFYCAATDLFRGVSPPVISVRKYLERIFKYANCSPSCFVVAYAYLDRFTQVDYGRKRILITSLSVHRLLITSVMLAAKFLDDQCYNNAYYARVGGISTAEMNRLELEFLFRFGFHLHVPLQMFDNYCTQLLLLECETQPAKMMTTNQNTNYTNHSLMNGELEDDDESSGITDESTTAASRSDSVHQKAHPNIASVSQIIKQDHQIPAH